MKELWAVEFNPGNQSVIPEGRFWPDFEAFGLEVVVADQFHAIVSAELGDLDVLLRDYPYCRVAGHPADGRHVGESGNEVYVFNGALLDTEQELWEAFGLRPEDFDAEDWHDADDVVVRSCVPTF